MVESNAERTSTRFILPVSILSIGLVLMNIDISIPYLNFHQITTLGIALFALGSFTFIVLINDARNNVMEDEEVISLSYVLIIYASILTIAYYEGLFALETISLSICIILGIGTSFALLVDISNVERFEVVN